MQSKTQTRRQREEKLIADSRYLDRALPSDCRKLATALEAAYVREDAIRRLAKQLDETLVPSGREFARKLDAILDGA